MYNVFLLPTMGCYKQMNEVNKAAAHEKQLTV